MAKKQPARETSSGSRSPLDKRRSKHFENFGPMPQRLRNILDEELTRPISFVEADVEKTLPAIELIVLNLSRRAMNGDVWAKKLLLSYLSFNSEQEKDRAKEEREKRRSESFKKAFAEWRRKAFPWEET